MRVLGVAFALCTLLTVYLIFRAADPTSISPQGCRMSWMSPSYIRQTQFDANWTKLSARYSLWLYREVGWDAAAQFEGNPVLFITGNSGSSHQARSIASSAARQYYSSPGIVNPDFRHTRPLDVFTVEFNEDMSALHGPTLESQAEYVSDAISYILSSYPLPRRKITILGHSMGGIVARSLLTHSASRWNNSDISAIITMSTPHSLPPLRLDRAMESLYHRINTWENSHTTPPSSQVATISICGGATDSLVPSETCILPPLSHPAALRNSAFRETVHTTNLPGVWTGVGHVAMVWCHQVRWRVARAALELGAATDPSIALSQWFPSSQTPAVPSVAKNSFKLDDVPHTLVTSDTLRLSSPTGQSHTYLLSIPLRPSPRFTLLLARGILAHPPATRVHQASALRISLYTCSSADTGTCIPVTASDIHSRLIPLPMQDKSFPLDDEGVDESEGVLYWSGGVAGGWLAVSVENGGDGWLVAGFDQQRILNIHTGHVGLVAGSRDISLKSSRSPLRTTVNFPNLLAHALLVYRINSVQSGDCSGSSTLPIIHTSPNSPDSHFYIPSPDRPDAYIHTHSTGPFLLVSPRVGTSMDIYTPDSCMIDLITVSIDWRASIGRAGGRYWIVIALWAVGVICFAMGDSYREWDLGTGGADPFPSPAEALVHFSRRRLPVLATGIVFLSAIRLPAPFVLGNRGLLFFAPLSALVLVLATGVAWIFYGFALVLVHAVSKMRQLCTRRVIPSRTSWKTQATFGAVMMLVGIKVVPTQVLFVLVYLRHVWRCASSLPTRKSPVTPSPRTEGWKAVSAIDSNHAQQMHLLLLVTSLLPLVGPVLAVWARTLLTAGLWVPFKGDHNLLQVIFFAVVLESSDLELKPALRRWIGIATCASWYVAAVWTIALGARFSYGVYAMANSVAMLMLGRVLWQRWRATDE